MYKLVEYYEAFLGGDNRILPLLLYKITEFLDVVFLKFFR